MNKIYLTIIVYERQFLNKTIICFFNNYMDIRKLQEQTNEKRDKQLSQEKCQEQQNVSQQFSMVSDKYEIYVKTLKKYTVKQDELIRQLAEQNVFYLSNNQNKTDFSIQQIKRNIDGSSRTLQISLCQFILRINIYINDQQSQIHKQNIYQRGSYGRIYVDNDSVNSFAIKCISCESLKDYKFMKNGKGTKQFHTFHKDIIDILKQYSFIKVFSALKAGPKAINPYGFDIIFNATCAQFCQQLCQRNFMQYIRSKQNLMKKLQSFHLLKIIHNDIKPQNIVYSHQYQSTVFCDFGLTSIIKQKIGQKTLTRYRGSFAYSSPQMCELFQKYQFGYVDLYYNDLHCLQKAIEISRIRQFQLAQTKNYLHHSFQNENRTQILEQKQNLTIILHKFNLFNSQCQSISQLAIQPTSKMQFIYLTKVLNYCLTLNLTDFNKKFIQSLSSLIRRNPNLTEKFAIVKHFCLSGLKIQQFLNNLNFQVFDPIKINLGTLVQNSINCQSKQKEKIKNINLKQQLQASDSQFLKSTKINKYYFEYILMAYARWISFQPYYDLQKKIQLTHKFIELMNITVQINVKVDVVVRFEELKQIYLLLSFIREKFSNWPIWIEKSQVLTNISNCYISIFDQYQIFKEIYELLIRKQKVPFLKINYIVQYFFCQTQQLALSQRMQYRRAFQKIEQLLQINQNIFKNQIELEQLKISMKIFQCLMSINQRQIEFNQLQLFKILREIQQKRWQYNLNYKIILLVEQMIISIQRSMDRLKSIEILYQKLKSQLRTHLKLNSRRIINLFQQIVRKYINMGALSKAKKMLENQRKRVKFDKWFYDRYSFLFIYLSFAAKEWEQTYQWFDRYFNQLTIFRKINLFSCFYRKIQWLPTGKYAQEAVILLNHYRLKISSEIEKNSEQLKKLNFFDQIRFSILFSWQLESHTHYFQQGKIKYAKFIEKNGKIKPQASLNFKHITIEQKYQQLLSIQNQDRYLPQDKYKSRKYEDWQIQRIISCGQVLLEAFNKGKGYKNLQIPCKIAFEYAYWIIQHFDFFDFVNNFQFIRYSLDMNMRSGKVSEVIKFMLLCSQAATTLPSREIYKNFTYCMQWIIKTGQLSLLVQILNQLNIQCKFKVPLHRVQFNLFVAQLLKRLVAKQHKKIQHKVFCCCLKELFNNVSFYYVETKKRILRKAIRTFLAYCQLQKQQSLVVKRKRRYLEKMELKLKISGSASAFKIKHKQQLIKIMFDKGKQVFTNSNYVHYSKAFLKICDNLII